MQRKINNMVICLQMGKNLMTKTPPGDFQVTILETPLRLRSQFAWTEFAQCLCNLFIVWRLLKQSFYMSRVRRKEDPKTYSWIPRKSYLNSEHDLPTNQEQNPMYSLSYSIVCCNIKWVFNFSRKVFSNKASRP